MGIEKRFRNKLIIYKFLGENETFTHKGGNWDFKFAFIINNSGRFHAEDSEIALTEGEAN